jgi:sterol desaturase/sphingolipid hydroxylase (fatty acid hydroxylase superfamily)
MQSFKNLAEGTFDEAFAKIVHTKLYQIRLLRHNRLQCIISTMTVPGTEALHNERDKTMNPIVYAIPVFMLTILLEAWVARRRGVAVYDIPDAITSLHHGLLSQVTNAFTKIATLGIYIAVYEAYRFTEWSMSSIPLWILALVLYDLCYYWAHRMGHEVNVMWASHVVHHSSEYYNLSTALRQTSTGALFGWVFYLPLAVLGIPWQMLVIVGLIDLLYQYWVHTELIGRLGILDRILVTPSNHRVHHGQNDYCIDKNYGGILVLWDRLFGTFADERDDEKFATASASRCTASARSRATCITTPTCGRCPVRQRAGAPSWVSGWRHRAAGPTNPSNISSPAPLPALMCKPRAAAWYVALQCAVLVPFVSHFIGVAKGLDRGTAAVYALGILVTAVALGALLERFVWGKWLEQVRLLALGVSFAAVPQWFGFEAPLLLKVRCWCCVWAVWSG